MPHENKTYHVVARQIGFEADIEASCSRSAVHKACEMLAANLPKEFVSRNPLTVHAFSDDGFRLFAKNIWWKSDGKTVKIRTVAMFEKI